MALTYQAKPETITLLRMQVRDIKALLATSRDPDVIESTSALLAQASWDLGEATRPVAVHCDGCRIHIRNIDRPEVEMAARADPEQFEELCRKCLDDLLAKAYG